jgi:hypothetical protein
MPTARSMADVLALGELEETDETDRYVEMSLAIALPGQPAMLRAGGRWDRREDCYVARAEAGMQGAAVMIHPGQLSAVQWFALWLAAHAARRNKAGEPIAPAAFDAMSDEEKIAHDARIVGRLAEAEAITIDTDPANAYAALFAGGRRAGKSWIAVALAISYAVDFPKSIIWLVSPTDTSDDELVRYVRERLPREWIDREAGDGWELCNGSQILLLSAYEPESLKRGEAHLVVLNEGQRMKRRAYTLARGATIDCGGLVIVCANPPVEAGDQQWVYDFATDASNHQRQAIYLQFDARKNPHIDKAALYALAGELDERTAAVEVWGEFRAAVDAVAYNWVRLENELRVPTTIPDVTEIFMAMIEEGENILQVVGLDVQRIPYIGGPVYRFFGDPDRRLVRAWIVDEVVLEGGDEEDFCDELFAKGYGHEETLIICDATAEYQHSRRRTTDQPPPEWAGRGSWSLIRQKGYRRIVAPDRNLRRKNPPIQDRIRAFTSMINSKERGRRLFADPKLAAQSCKAIREWKTQRGSVHRTQYEAHLGDGISYVINRLFPRRAISDLTNEE